MKKLKVAVQLFGHLRTFDKCAQSLQKNLLSHYDCDVFIHSWDKLTHNTSSAPKKITTNVDENILKKIEILYKPISIKIEKNINFENEVTAVYKINHKKMNGRNISSNGFRSMMYSKNAVNELRKKHQLENEIQYDVIIMIRPDVKLLSPFKIENILKQINVTNINGRFVAASLKNRPENNLLGNLMSDILYFAEPETMDKIVNIANQISNDTLENNFYNHETCLYSELQKNGVPSNFLLYFFDRDWTILRLSNFFTANNIGQYLKAVRKKTIALRLNKEEKYLLLKILPSFCAINFNICIRLFKFKLLLFFGKNKYYDYE